MSQPAPTREERIARYVGQFSAETLAAMLVEAEDAYEKVGTELDGWRRAYATIADKTTNPNAPKNRDRTPGT